MKGIICIFKKIIIRNIIVSLDIRHSDRRRREREREEERKKQTERDREKEIKSDIDI